MQIRRIARAAVAGTAALALLAPPAGADGLTPEAIERTVLPGTTYEVPDGLRLALSEAGRTADVLLAVDATSSMAGPRMAAVREDVSRLLGQVRAALPSSQASLVEFRDPSDNPEVPEQAQRVPFTTDDARIIDALGGIEARGGGDEPEGYNHLLQTAAGSAFGWRPGAYRIVVVFGDDSPHGAGARGLDGCSSSTSDPRGLKTDEVLASLKATGAALVMVPARPEIRPCYASMVSRSTASSEVVDPGTATIGDRLVSKVQVQPRSFGSVQLKASGPVAPLVQLGKTDFGAQTAPKTLSTSEKIVVPADQAGGVYEGLVQLLGDGKVLATQTLKITVPACEDDSEPYAPGPVSGGLGTLGNAVPQPLGGVVHTVNCAVVIPLGVL